MASSTFSSFTMENCNGEKICLGKEVNKHVTSSLKESSVQRKISDVPRAKHRSAHFPPNTYTKWVFRKPLQENMNSHYSFGSFLSFLHSFSFSSLFCQQCFCFLVFFQICVSTETIITVIQLLTRHFLSDVLQGQPCWHQFFLLTSYNTF